jgi:hypothetical protein
MAGGRIMNVQYAAIRQILKDAGKPLHTKEIEAGLWSIDGKTLGATFSACRHSDIKNHEDQSIFVKVVHQTLFLRDMQLVTVCDEKEPERSAESSSVKSKETFSFLDAAVAVRMNRIDHHHQ